MKCLCGYEYEEEKVDWSKLSYSEREKRLGLNPPPIVVLKGDEPFGIIEISTYGGTSSFIMRGRGSVKLFACPKCGTVKVDI